MWIRTNFGSEGWGFESQARQKSSTWVAVFKQNELLSRLSAWYILLAIRFPAFWSLESLSAKMNRQFNLILFGGDF